MLRRASAALVAGLISTPATAAPGAQAAFVALKQTQERARAVWRNAHPTLLTGIRIATTGADPASRARDFIARHTALLGASDFIIDDIDAQRGRTLVRMHQEHAGLTVADRSLVLTLDADGAVTRVVNDAAPVRRVEVARFDAEAAARKALEHVHGAPTRPVPVNARKVVFAAGDHGVEGYIAHVARGPFDVVEVRVNGVDGTIFGVKAHQKW